ncbi:hypothetical protein THAOC_06016 [Thalassiosira oceanica]|uniref:Peptidase A2 domain-containing protein n=1 Tax=Thalassiosira oceanica TaxID=159749 RepID=K0T422_THAOC|nr:hypothetical protein THAOC_06016 [Thalassiosira oceanica]|eukprot:EJK72455.1 hypothetical protein THAOC_06016 [Thalassiosira oceanica]
MFLRVHTLLVVSLGCWGVGIVGTLGFAPPSPTKKRHVRPLRQQQQVENDTLLESLRSMRVAELKIELESLNVSTANALEKEELVQRLLNAKRKSTSSVSKKKKKKKRRRSQESDLAEEPEEPVNRAGDDWSIIAPFKYYDLESSKSVAANNADDLYIRPSPGRYPAIEVEFSIGHDAVKMNLLVDTACSGLVLSPQAVADANRQVPGIIMLQDAFGGATMTSAGGTSASGVARWNSAKFMVQGSEVNMQGIAACQDIGALPFGIDGILGLSFLGQFKCTDFDRRNELRLSKDNPEPSISDQADTVAKGNLLMTKLRIYMAEVLLDGRGPVKLLVDTGAASSFLNWKGVSDLRLSNASPQIEPIREAIGAMGADNNALRLTDRFVLKRRYNLVADSVTASFCPGVALDGTKYGEGINVDIGDIPVLEQLRSDDVGGIMGSDLLMMCDVVRFSFNGASPKLVLMKRQLT